MIVSKKANITGIVGVLQRQGYYSTAVEAAPTFSKFLRERGILLPILHHASSSGHALMQKGIRNTIFAYSGTVSVVEAEMEECPTDLQISIEDGVSPNLFDKSDTILSAPSGKIISWKVSYKGTTCVYGGYLVDMNLFILRDIAHTEHLPLWRGFVKFAQWVTRENPELLQKTSTVEPPPIEILLGCDPELELIDGETNEVVNCNRIELPEDYGTSSPVGVDGAGNQLELRPSPAETPEELVQNLKELLEEALNRLPDFSFGLKGNRYPLGGHIHLNIDSNPDLIQALDYFIGKPLLGLSGTARGGYAQLGAYRSSSHPGFEYRTPPSSYLWHPEFTRIVFTLAYNIAYKWESYEPIEFGDTRRQSHKTLRKWLIKNNLLTPGDADNYLAFIQRYKLYLQHEKPDAFLCNWGILVEEPSSSASIRLEFSSADTFNPDHRATIQSAFQEIFNEFSSPYKTKVILYGLGEHRGQKTIAFSPYPFDSAPQIDQGGLRYIVINPVNAIGLEHRVGYIDRDTIQFWIGLPRVLRTAQSRLIDLRPIMLELFRSVKTIITREERVCV